MEKAHSNPFPRYNLKNCFVNTRIKRHIWFCGLMTLLYLHAILKKVYREIFQV